jgi:predicted ribosomally synthesized peptide with nif11-like leader
MSFKNVKDFYQRLANDAAFRSQIQNVQSKEECSQIVKSAGYDFTQQEYEEYTAQLLDSDSTNNELKDLNEQELEAVFGGATFILGNNQSQLGRNNLMYGVVRPQLL